MFSPETLSQTPYRSLWDNKRIYIPLLVYTVVLPKVCKQTSACKNFGIKFKIKSRLNLGYLINDFCLELGARGYNMLVPYK